MQKPAERSLTNLIRLVEQFAELARISFATGATHVESLLIRLSKVSVEVSVDGGKLALRARGMPPRLCG